VIVLNTSRTTQSYMTSVIVLNTSRTTQSYMTSVIVLNTSRTTQSYLEIVFLLKCLCFTVVDVTALHVARHALWNASHATHLFSSTQLHSNRRQLVLEQFWCRSWFVGRRHIVSDDANPPAIRRNRCRLPSAEGYETTVGRERCLLTFSPPAFSVIEIRRVSASTTEWPTTSSTGSCRHVRREFDGRRSDRSMVAKERLHRGFTDDGDDWRLGRWPAVPVGQQQTA